MKKVLHTTAFILCLAFVSTSMFLSSAFAGNKGDETFDIVVASLFEELLTNEPGEFHVVPYWGYDYDKTAFRKNAMKHAFRYVFEEQVQQMKANNFVPMTFSSYNNDLVKAHIPFMLQLTQKSQDISWVLDPGVLDRRLYEVVEFMGYRERGLWGIFLGDELFCNAVRVPDISYPYRKTIDEDIRLRFGNGEFGLPEDMNDDNPFRLIAFRRWAAEQITVHYKEVYEIVKKIDGSTIIFGPDPFSAIPPDDYSAWAPYVDVITAQTVGYWTSRSIVDQLSTGYTVKLLSDLTGKPVWPAIQMVYAMKSLTPPSPEDIREVFSQVYRNGGSGVFLLAVEWYDRELNHHQYSSPERWEAILELLKVMTNMNKVRVPQDSDCAILYSSDTYCADKGMRQPDEMKSAYAILGQLNGAWFKFIDDRQIDRGEVELSQYKMIFVPYAKYEREKVVQALENYVREGGILVVADPEAFTYDITSKTMEESQLRLFGVKRDSEVTGDWTIRGSNEFPDIQLEKAQNANAWAIAPIGEVKELLYYPDGSIAVSSNNLGKGNVMYFGFNPFTKDAAQSHSWIQFFRELMQTNDIILDRDIWRFKLPPLKRADEEESDDFCLTSNYIKYYSYNSTPPQRNLKISGTYSYSKEPDRIKDIDVNSVPFGKGKLTDRARAGISRQRANRASNINTSEWVVTFSIRDAVDITFDLQKVYTLSEVQLWWSEQLPYVEVKGSKDGEEWITVALYPKQERTSDVKSINLPISGEYRYLKLSMGPRDLDQRMTLVEVEIWGK